MQMQRWTPGSCPPQVFTRDFTAPVDKGAQSESVRVQSKSVHVQPESVRVQSEKRACAQKHLEKHHEPSCRFKGTDDV